MKLKEILRFFKKDNRELKDIFNDAIDKVDETDIVFNPICGREEYKEEISESEALKNAKPLDVKFKELSLYS